MWTGWQREEHSGSRRKLWKLCGGRRGSELGWDVCGKQTALENKDERIQYELYCLLLLTLKTFRGINLNLLLHMLLHNSILFKVLFHKGIHTCCCGMAHRLKYPDETINQCFTFPTHFTGDCPITLRPDLQLWAYKGIQRQQTVSIIILLCYSSTLDWIKTEILQNESLRF